MSLEPAGKAYLISPKKWPEWYIYMVNDRAGNVRGWRNNPGRQGHWTFEVIGSNLYKVAPEEWPNWYMYMHNGTDGNVRGWNGDQGDQGHWYVEQKEIVIVDGKPVSTYILRPKAYPGRYMCMENNEQRNVRGCHDDPGTADRFIFTEI